MIILNSQKSITDWLNHCRVVGYTINEDLHTIVSKGVAIKNKKI